ncbi:Succinate dehydrogenase assembly factor 4, mitochondrial [Pseudocercospora fuligena]|uniref:Succinate dehydrogenase assembly factor 4, mitochondrial n=1 Tax=Pseudocercospora fuligena TaxID=685502 RepID=A0A8H6R6B1_9PEZI|nr:Succinate dehydrogenase assembly factor 4, mitochondrial [Pseudocercospora fuligena]
MQSIPRASRTIRPGFFRRPLSTSTTARSAWSTGPSPPRLPKEEQEIFEKLQQQSTGAFSTPRELKEDAGDDVSAAAPRSSEADKMLEQLRERARLAAKGDGEELHPNVRRGAPPEFEGDTNPKTGEVGGPKNDPLRWKGDWSYNGRVTDF